MEANKRRIGRSVMTVLWLSFVGATIASFVLFALFDPLDLAMIGSIPLPQSHLGGYTLGFLLFWLLTTCCCGMTAFMLNLSDEQLEKDLHKHEADEGV